VVVEGLGHAVSDRARIEAFVATYNPKYAWSFTVQELCAGGLFEVVPRKASAWLGDQGPSFSATATRWRFDAAPRG